MEAIGGEVLKTTLALLPSHNAALQSDVRGPAGRAGPARAPPAAAAAGGRAAPQPAATRRPGNGTSRPPAGITSATSRREAPAGCVRAGDAAPASSCGLRRAAQRSAPGPPGRDPRGLPWPLPGRLRGRFPHPAVGCGGRPATFSRVALARPLSPSGRACTSAPPRITRQPPPPNPRRARAPIGRAPRRRIVNTARVRRGGRGAAGANRRRLC